MEKIHIPDWIVTLLDLETENANMESHSQEEFIGMC